MGTHTALAMGFRTTLLVALVIPAAIAGIPGCPFGNHAEDKSDDEPTVADPETTTPHGCTCISLCGATIEDGFNLDWCYTEGECGEYSIIHGYWDHCLYKDSAKPEYVSLDWKTKHDMLWNEIKADSSFGAFYREDILTESVITTFENEWDVMPAGRRKALHGIGAICPFTVDVSPDSPFTGLIKPGAQIHGFIRMGSGVDFMDPKAAGFLPGASIKILRSGTTSANWVLFDSLSPLPDGNHNMFAKPLKNHVAEPEDILVIIAAQKFLQQVTVSPKLDLVMFAHMIKMGMSSLNLIFLSNSLLT